MPKTHPITEDSPLLHDANCVYCHVDLVLNDQVVVCDECSSPHHCECWELNRNCCATFGCNGFGLIGVDGTLPLPAFQLLRSDADTVVIDKARIGWFSRIAIMPQALDWSPNSKLIALSHWNRYIRIFDVAHQDLVFELNGQSGSVSSVNWSPNGKLLAAAYSTNQIRIWDTDSGRHVTRLGSHLHLPFTDVCWSPDGHLLATANGDSIYIWDLMSPKPIAAFHAYTNQIYNRIYNVTWSSNGQYIASVSADLTVRLWNVLTRKEVGGLPTHARHPKSVKWSPDGSRIAIKFDQIVRLWTVGTDQLPLSFRDYDWQMNDIEWSPDGRYIVSNMDDGTLQILDCENQFAKSVLYKGESEILCVKWSPDGTQIAFGASDHTVRTISLV